ncbi:alpha/beta hydrolase [bacterium]|nr:alpha/beta hydrolase [bacterium]
MPNNSFSDYVDIPIGNNCIFALLNRCNSTSISLDLMPIGVGLNYINQYYYVDLGCAINLSTALASYNIPRSSIKTISFYFKGTNNVGDLESIGWNDEDDSLPATYLGDFDYNIPIDSSFFNPTTGLYIFKIRAASTNIYTTLDLMSSYIRVEYLLLDDIYIYSAPNTTRYLNDSELNLDGLVLMARFLDETERQIYDFSSNPNSDEKLNPDITQITFTYKVRNTTKTAVQNIVVEQWKRECIDISYDNNTLQKADIYIPKQVNPNDTFPVLLTIHGGGFYSGQKEDFNYIRKTIVSQGLIHVNMNYRLMPDPHAQSYVLDASNANYLNMLEDIRLLILHLYNNSNRYNIDVSKIALMGYSAGGNLAFNYTLRSLLNSGNDKITSSIPVELIITEGAPFYEELSLSNDGLTFDNGSYIQESSAQNGIKAEMEALIHWGLSSYFDISKIKPLTFLTIGQTLPLNLFVQGIGYKPNGDYSNGNEKTGDTLVSNEGILLMSNNAAYNVNPNYLFLNCKHDEYQLFFESNYVNYKTTLISLLNTFKTPNGGN